MAISIFVSSLAYSVSSEQLKEFFEQMGNVESAQVIMERESSQSKGFRFVEMSKLTEAQRVIKELDGKELEGRAIAVSAARARTDSPTRSSRPQAKFNGRRRR